MTAAGLGFLVELEQIIEQRKGATPDTSYTAKLYAAGASRIAQKVGEEAIEVALASVARDRPRIVAESADLLYHLIVLLRFHDLRLEDVARELGQRQGRSPTV